MSKNVIVYLIRGDENSITSLERSLSLLKDNFLPWSPADILVFHEANMCPEQIIGRTAGLTVKTALVDFSSIPPGTETLSPAQRGYRHMCHFFAIEIFSRQELNGYDYYMRLDDDSYIMSPLRFNVFERMQAEQIHYAYRVVLRDKARVCFGISDVIKSHFTTNNSKAKIFCPPPYKIFYNNFEICDLAWFRTPPWQEYFAAIERANGIWKYRWGDAPIRYYGIMNLLPREQLWCIKEMHYRHQSEWLPGYTRRTFLEAIRHYSKMISLVLKDLFH